MSEARKRLTVEHGLALSLMLGFTIFLLVKYHTLGHSDFPYLIVLGISTVFTSYFTLKLKRTSNKSIPSKILCALGCIYVVYVGFLALVVFLSWWSHRNFNREVTRVAMDSLGERIGRFRTLCGRFPTSREGLNVLVDPNYSTVCPRFPRETLIEGGIVRLDAWDNPFIYESDGSGYVLKSLFQEGAQNGSYDDNWSFEWDGLFDPLPHQRIRATSSNPNDPVLIIDPHRNQFQVGR